MAALRDDLTGYLLGEKRAVSAVWLANVAGVPAVESQAYDKLTPRRWVTVEHLPCLLHRALEAFAKEHAKEKLGVTYLVAGMTHDGVYTVQIVPAAEVESEPTLGNVLPALPDAWCLSFHRDKGRLGTCVFMPRVRTDPHR